MVNKKVVIISTIICIILVAGIIYISLNKPYEEPEIENEITETNGVENKIQENVEKENTQVEEKVENTEKEENTEVQENKTEEPKVKEDKKEQKSELTGEEKAKGLVKKEWGENDKTVYYYVEEQVSDDLYIISVRDAQTTEELSTYEVDNSAETVEKY